MDEPRKPRELRTIVHDLRNVAGTLRGVVDIVVLRVSAADPRLAEVCAAAARQLDRLGAAIDDLDALQGAAHVTPSPPSRQPPPPTDMIQHSIVVVEDDPAYGRLVATVLEERGHKVTLAITGEQALDAVAAVHPDVVLVDLGLPGIDGFEVARRLRSDKRPIRLVALTGDARDDTRQQASSAGFDDFVVKGGDLQALESALVPVA